MNKIQLLLKITISLCCVLLLVLPFCEVDLSDPEGNLHWQDSYIVSDVFTMAAYFPFMILWLAHYFVRRATWKKALTILLPVFCIPIFYLGSLSLMYHVPDFAPGYGMLISMVLLPLVVVYAFVALWYPES